VPSSPQDDDEPGDDPDDEMAENGPSGPFGEAFGASFPGFPPGFDLSGIDVSGLARALQSSGPLNWEVASQLASVVATGGQDEPVIDASDGEQFEELAHAAQTHVVAETGIAATFAASVRAIDRREWAALHLDALRPVLERLATTFGGLVQPESIVIEESSDPTDAIASVLPMIAPLLLGVQTGSMVGYLAQHALGRYDLPLPTADEPSLCFVVSNVDAFEAAWSLERADLRFYLAIHEVVHAAQRSVPWVRQRMLDLAIEYVSAYEVDASTLSSRLGDFDPADPSSLQALTEHPDELLGAMRSERQHEILRRVRVLHAVLEGYADVVLERVGGRLIPSFERIHEAMARHRLERGEAERFVEGLLGLATGREDYEGGAAFCAGVVERSGIDALHRLWERPEMAPTPNEFDAPGLWLARIDLDLDEG
jgi:putative hydrolase